jgi:hypothetical protein
MQWEQWHPKVAGATWWQIAKAITVMDVRVKATNSLTQADLWC